MSSHFTYADFESSEIDRYGQSVRSNSSNNQTPSSISYSPKPATGRSRTDTAASNYTTRTTMTANSNTSSNTASRSISNKDDIWPEIDTIPSSFSVPPPITDSPPYPAFLSPQYKPSPPSQPLNATTAPEKFPKSYFSFDPPPSFDDKSAATEQAPSIIGSFYTTTTYRNANKKQPLYKCTPFVLFCLGFFIMPAWWLGWVSPIVTKRDAVFRVWNKRLSLFSFVVIIFGGIAGLVVILTAPKKVNIS
ncbi:hypothetical protein BKA69DRAFT_475779 [Paraphysoderma sedebokerense]|nr:hypothetical protein BKA69DRAFT_475414 [Paraphysoderma sedebokerense]KAI9140884.1 hypothetical protein BKA69DRAFT_475779 [Paraphysoderma sedebokerense]